MAYNTSQYIRLALIVVGAIILFYFISSYNNTKNIQVTPETFYSNVPEKKEEVSHEEHPNNEKKHVKTEESSSSPEPASSDQMYQSVGNVGNDQTGLGGNQFPKDCYPKDQLTPKELLPQDSNSKWAQANPAGQGELKDQNFLNAGHHIGINTVGQSLRNANLQLRSEPPNPQLKVSPWLQSTIEPDTNRKPMEIGGCN